MIEAQDIELAKIRKTNEWVQLGKEFNYILYRSEEKMAKAQSREEIRAAFAESMNSLIGLLKE